MKSLDRRTIVRAIGAAATLGGLGGASAIAGAQDDEGESGGDGDEPEYGDWFDDTETYEETVDKTDQDEVTVEVGAGDSGFMFDPPAIRVAPGTTVVWEWTGRGGSHNVVHVPEEEEEREIENATGADESEFESELSSEEGVTFEHEFEDEESATYLYICEPHETLGMRGAVVVDGDGGGGDGENG